MSKPFRILLAEDDDGHALLIRRNLLRGGFPSEVIRVHDGQEALDYIYRASAFAGRQSHGTLLILLDINMPRISGVEVLRRVKSDVNLNRLPVIMLTTTDDPVEVATCYRLGCNLYITKPVDYSGFADALGRLSQFLEVTTVLSESELRED
jgi:CheY-like chemotaxis protein